MILLAHGKDILQKSIQTITNNYFKLERFIMFYYKTIVKITSLLIFKKNIEILKEDI